MPHLEQSTLHRYIDDPMLLLIPVSGLRFVDTSIAMWRARGPGATVVEKTLSGGEITLLDGATAKATYPEDAKIAAIDDTEVVLVVDVDPAEVTSLSYGQWHWDARAGGAEAQVVAVGSLVITARV